MQDVILLVSISAIFIFGYFLMNKLDAFLENNWNEQENALAYGENSLRIGFSNPFMAGGLSDVLETYGKQHPDVSIHIFSGEESELCRELETHKLDIIFYRRIQTYRKKRIIMHGWCFFIAPRLRWNMLTCPLSRLPRIKSRKKHYGEILKNHLSSIFY